MFSRTKKEKEKVIDCLNKKNRKLHKKKPKHEIELVVVRQMLTLTKIEKKTKPKVF